MSVPALADLYEASARERLAGSALGALQPGEIVVDLFCGGGGATAGVEMAGLSVAECVNHSELAIATHKANHPGTRHHRGDVWKATPASVSLGRPVGLLWASPDCRHFSRARCAAPVGRRVRDLAWVAVKWARSDTPPRIIIVENVAEFLTWGPVRVKVDGRGREMTDAQGRVLCEPVPERAGETFGRWCGQLRRAGYEIEWRVLDAADYGAACRRKRLFVVARRDGQPICWPEKTHEATKEGGAGGRGTLADSAPGAVADHDRRRAASADARPQTRAEVRQGPKRTGREGGARDHEAGRVHGHQHDRGLVPLWATVPDASGQQGFGDGRASHAAAHSPRLRPHRTAAEIIDWSDLGRSIFGRKKPLAPKTLARIAEGIRRYVLNDPAPFVLRVTQTGGAWVGGGWPVDGPLPTQTTRQDLAVCTPLVMSAGGPECAAVPVSAPLGTVLPRDHRALVLPLLQAFRGTAKARRPDEPLPTITAGNGPGRGAGAGHALGLIAPVLGVLRNHADAQRVDQPAPTIAAQGTHAALVAALLVSYYGASTGGQRADKPLGTCTTRDRHGLVCVVIEGAEYVIVGVLFRMLKPRELAAAMGFPAEYIWPRTQREAVRLIGNAVSPPMAAALVRAVLPGGVGGAA